MDMIRLGPDMMARYEIANRRPARVNAVEFGMSAQLLGAVNRLIDDAGAGVGLCCLEAEDHGLREKLARQDGLYTVVVRGYVGEEAVRREQVVQCVLQARGPEAVEALAADEGIEFGIVDDSDDARALSKRFEALRARAGRAAIPMLRLNANALSESLAFRSEPDEAARQCAEMNYLDEMLHFAEPFNRLTMAMPGDFRRRFPLDAAPGARFTDAAGLERAMAARRVFDSGLFLMAAAGWLNGCDTLYDCMKHPRLRRFVGEGFTREIMPALADADRNADRDANRDAVAQCVIECFARYENPLNRNRLLRAAEGMLGRFVRGPLPLMRHLADEAFEPPRALTFALAETIMLYAGARKGDGDGEYRVARGSKTEPIHDDPGALRAFAALSHDMPPESLSYAALADRELWGGADLRAIDGLEARVALDIAAIQRDPGYLPEFEEQDGL